MSHSPAVRRPFLLVGVLVLLGLTWLGVSGGLHQLPRSHSPGEWVQSLAQLGYGTLSLLGVLTRFRGRQGRVIVWLWLVSMLIAAGLAPVVWGGASVGIGLVSAGAVLLVAPGIVWLVRAERAA